MGCGHLRLEENGRRLYASLRQLEDILERRTEGAGQGRSGGKEEARQYEERGLKSFGQCPNTKADASLRLTVSSIILTISLIVIIYPFTNFAP